MSDITGNKISKYTLLDTLLTLKQSTMRDTHVAEICTVESIGDEISAKIINTDTKIKCIKLQDLEIQKNDIVLVLFTDTNYKINLSKIKADKKTQVLNNNTNLHSLQYAVIIGLIHRNNQN